MPPRQSSGSLATYCIERSSNTAVVASLYFSQVVSLRNGASWRRILETSLPFDSVNVTAFDEKDLLHLSLLKWHFRYRSSGCPCRAVSPYGVEIVGPLRVLRDRALDALGCGP